MKFQVDFYGMNMKKTAEKNRRNMQTIGWRWRHGVLCATAILIHWTGRKCRGKKRREKKKKRKYIIRTKYLQIRIERRQSHKKKTESTASIQHKAYSNSGTPRRHPSQWKAQFRWKCDGDKVIHIHINLANGDGLARRYILQHSIFPCEGQQHCTRIFSSVLLSFVCYFGPSSSATRQRGYELCALHTRNSSSSFRRSSAMSQRNVSRNISRNVYIIHFIQQAIVIKSNTAPPAHLHTAQHYIISEQKRKYMGYYFIYIQMIPAACGLCIRLHRITYAISASAQRLLLLLLLQCAAQNATRYSICQHNIHQQYTYGGGLSSNSGSVSFFFSVGYHCSQHISMVRQRVINIMHTRTNWRT